MRRSCWRCSFVIVLAVALAAGVQAEAQPGSGDVSFAIQFAGGKTTYAVGERIPIELSFSTSSEHSFQLDQQSNDNSGRVTPDHFHVTPAVRDPLQTYFENGFLGGGIRSVAELSTRAQTLDEDLNQCAAFDHPGHYSVSVTSQRVTREGAPTAPLAEDPSMPLESNRLEFDVVAADAAWQAQAANLAVAVLGDPAAKEGERTGALATLRFLDTPAAVRALVAEMGRSAGCWACTAGLLGSSHPAQVVAEMERQMGMPEYAISGQFLDALARLKLGLNEKPLPRYPEADPVRQAEWSAERGRRSERQQHLDDELYARAARLFGGKTDRARAETLNTVLLRPNTDAAQVTLLHALPGEEVARAFLILPASEQETLLLSFWERMKVPAMAGALQQVAQAPEFADGQLRNLVLVRLAEMDLEDAAPLLRAEIEHPHVDGGGTVKIDTLGLLPDKMLAQYDDLLAERLEQPGRPTFELDAQLVGRFATRAVLARVKAAYAAAEGSRSCVADDGFATYFLRMEVEFGLAVLRSAPHACMEHALPAAVKLKRWGAIEPVLVAKLNGADLNAARSAAETLALYGGASAEAALWKRIERFHEQWAGRSAELNWNVAGPTEGQEAEGFQYGLFQAMGSAQGWVLGDGQVNALEELALGQAKNTVATWHSRQPVPVQVGLYDPAGVTVTLDERYTERTIAALRGKLAQYPAGTEFAVSLFGSGRTLAPVVDAMREVAAERGLRVTVEDPGPEL